MKLQFGLAFILCAYMAIVVVATIRFSVDFNSPVRFLRLKLAPANYTLTDAQVALLNSMQIKQVDFQVRKSFFGAAKPFLRTTFSTGEDVVFRSTFHSVMDSLFIRRNRSGTYKVHLGKRFLTADGKLAKKEIDELLIEIHARVEFDMLLRLTAQGFYPGSN